MACPLKERRTSPSSSTPAAAASSAIIATATSMGRPSCDRAAAVALASESVNISALRSWTSSCETPGGNTDSMGTIT